MQLKHLFGFNWVEIADVGGCAANDGWARTVMGFWAANDKAWQGLGGACASSIANNNGWVEVGKKTAEVEKDHGVREATGGIVMKGQKGRRWREARDEGVTNSPTSIRTTILMRLMSYTTEFATSFAPVGMGGWDGGHEDRVKDAFEYMEGLYGTPIATRMMTVSLMGTIITRTLRRRGRSICTSTYECGRRRIWR